MTDRPRQHLIIADAGGMGIPAEVMLAATRRLDHAVVRVDAIDPPAPPDEMRALMTKTAAPTDRRQSLRAVELLLPRALYDRLEDLRAVQAPALTLPDFLVKLLPAAAEGLAGAIEDIDRAGRLVVER